jgi:hypothetical protein
MSNKLPLDFNPEEYLNLNPDIKKAGVNAGEHFLEYGQQEGRVYISSKPSIGIAIITCDRFPQLTNLVTSIHNFTGTPHELIICNDSKNLSSKFIGSELNVNVIGYKNQGVIRNKNRALYYFTEINPKDIIIIIEDDVEVTEFSWEKKWIEAALLYGQINICPSWFYDENLIKHYKGGDGVPNNPAIFSVLTGQCTAVKKDLIKNMFGYFDSRFKGYGYGHVEWTNRFIRSNFGGRVVAGQYHYFGLIDNFIYQPNESFKNPEDLLRNNNYYKITANRNGFIKPPSDILEDFHE